MAVRNGAPIVILFNRDLRIHDHPALTAAATTGAPLIPLFVIEPALCAAPASANRAAFLIESLADLRQSLRRVGGQLFVRVGEPVDTAMRIAHQVDADAIYASEDYSPRAVRRQERLDAACTEARILLDLFPGPTVVPAGDLVPTGGDHFKVFTPYWRRWRASGWRPVSPAPRRLTAPPGLPAGPIPTLRSLSGRPTSPRRPSGGETPGREAWGQWRQSRLAGYADNHDDLAGDRTSRLSPYLHFGCLSATELVHDTADQPGAEAFVRQMCWRDFHHQVLNAFPHLSDQDYRPRPHRVWTDDRIALDAWREGRTGVAIVDAAMRQLTAEGWMHNRARLIAAAYLTRVLGVHWESGAQHFMDWLVDADLANNYGNWQWVAGTGNDTRPNRSFNLDRQAHRFDPTGAYVRRYMEIGAD